MYLLQLCVIFVCTFFVEYCHSQGFTFNEELVVPCGVKYSKQVDVRGSRAQRRAAEVIIADFKRDSFGCDEQGPKTLIKHKEVRIDLQDSKSFSNGGNKRWRNLQLQQNVPRDKGFPTTVATVLIRCDKQFPIRIVRDAFVRSMTKCAIVRLDVSP
ncbi:uncharacterized protein LOC124341392 [Daphnia pulicaria]|uniref:uncharacterized protein LOC124341392 n=1 Tax=Daphnia pulicaria TaxID=35523 RepID=UPI001EEB6E4F|nr:uncharacterized protein LOC124341392 [Daphnia pulicaria]